MITIDDSVTGTVTIHIARDPNDSAGLDGATNVGLIDLTNSNMTPVVGNLAELRISGNLGDDGPSVVRSITGPLVLDDIVDDLTVNTDLTGNASITAGDITGDIIISEDLQGDLTADSLGNISIGSSLGGSNGDITINSSYAGTIFIDNRYNGDITINGDLTGIVNVDSNFIGGAINVTGDLLVPGRIIVASQANNDDEPPIHIHGAIGGTGATTPLVAVGGTLSGTIAVDGSLNNANTASSGPEISVDVFNSIGAVGAIAINYDGDPGAGDEWAGGATVVVDSETYDGTDGNNTTDRVWNVSPCKGDMNSDGVVDVNDGNTTNDTGPFYQSSSTYAANFPGLEGSFVWHGDCNFMGGFNPATDEVAFANLIAGGCCLTDLIATCPWDLDNNLSIDLGDLSILLSNFGTATGAIREDGDLDGDEDVDLTDLAILLANYGSVCCPEGEPLEGDFDLLITPYNTSGYSGGGFAGEDDHFVFDLLIDIDEEDDDWTAAGLCLARANGAVFRLVADPNDPPVPGAGEPDKYTTFFSVPKSVNDSARFTNPFPTGGVAGSCHPLSGAAVYTTTSVHACWLDWDVDSADGPAAIARVVLDVSGVSGADTSGGYGSVYFSTTGPADVADIKVADLHASAAHKYAGGEMSELEGAFYVVGE